MNKPNITILAAIALLLSASLLSFRVAASPDGYPTAETPTLIASLSPPNATIGDDITWLIWTDPNCSGCDVYLEIFDMTNWTKIYEENETLGTLNECGSLEKVISSVGFQEHEYRFTARMTTNGIEMECSRYLELFEAPFSIVTWADPYEAIPGQIVELTIYESVYPYIDAVANITVYNSTHPSLWTLTDVTIPSTNGTRLIDIPTAGLVAGFYNVNVTATSALGTDSSESYFMLSDLIVTVDEYSYYIGEMVNVSIRTYPTVSEAGLQISSMFPLPPIIVVDENITLTNGEAYKLYNSSNWTPRDYYVYCNATIDTETVYGFTWFSLEPFDVYVECDKYEYTAGEAVNITISTTLPQPSAEFNLTITNSTGAEIWTHGPSYLDPNGEASVEFDTTGLPPDTYEVEAFVNNTQYIQSDYCYFEIFMPTFDVFATVEPDNVGYAMPRLNMTVVPEQVNANLTIEVTSSMGTYYTFTKNFSVSTYTYFIPTIGMPNGTYWVDVSVTSAVGTNSTWCWFSYSNGLDTDGDGLTDSQEQAILTLEENPDSDGDGFFDGMEVFHGTDPLDPTSVIPEQIFMQILTLVCLSPFIYLIAKQKNKISKH